MYLSGGRCLHHGSWEEKEKKQSALMLGTKQSVICGLELTLSANLLFANQ